MDLIFNCPKCDQELAVDSSGAGSQIDCPSCGQPITIPEPGSAALRPDGVTDGNGVRLQSNPISAMATSAAAKVEMHLKVPVHKTPSESLIEKPKAPLEFAAKESDKKIRVKTIRHTDCIEVGHDKFDEIVSGFLAKVGEANIINISPLSYTHLDIGSQKLMSEYAILVVFRG